MEAVEVEVHGRDERSVTVRLRGEFDLSGVSRFWSAIGEPERYEDVIVDLREVTFLDAAALRQLVTLDARSRRNGFALRIHAPPHPVASIFDLTGMDKRLPLHYSDREAGS